MCIRDRMYISCPCWMLLSAITLSAATASLVPLPFLNPYCSSPKQLSVSALVCNLFVIILSSIFDAWVRRLIVRWSLQFIAFGFFCIGITMVWRKSPGHTPVLYSPGIVAPIHSLLSLLNSSAFLLGCCRFLLPCRSSCRLLQLRPLLSSPLVQWCRLFVPPPVLVLVSPFPP